MSISNIDTDNSVYPGQTATINMTVGGAVIALELNMYWALFAGGVIGNMGSTTVRNLALRLIKREIGDK